MAVILRTLNVLNPAIPPINAKIRFMVDRPVLIGRTALAALLTFGLSFMVLRRLIPGRYAALVSVAPSIGLGVAAYVGESSRAGRALYQRVLHLFYGKQLEYVSFDLNSFHKICKRLDPNQTDFAYLWNFILNYDDLSGSALDLFNKFNHINKIQWCLQDAIDKKRPGVVESLLKNHSNQIEASKTTDYFSRVKDAKTTQALLGHFKDFAPTPALLAAIISRNFTSYEDDFTRCDHFRAIPGLWAQSTDYDLSLCTTQNKPDLAAVIKADWFLYTPNKTKTAIEEVDQMTFDAICRRCQDIDFLNDKKLDIAIHTDLWSLICKFDYHSTEENSLLIKLIKSFPREFLNEEFETAVKQNCPHVVEFLLSKTIKKNEIPISDRFFCWSRLQNAETAKLLQKYGFDVNEHPTLLDYVVYRDPDFYPRKPSGFTQTEHVSAILAAGIKDEYVEAVVEKLKAEKTEWPRHFLFILNSHLASKK